MVKAKAEIARKIEFLATVHTASIDPALRKLLMTRNRRERRREAEKARGRAYYWENKEKRTTYALTYNARKRGVLNANAREKRKTEPEKGKAASSKYRRANRRKINDASIAVVKLKLANDPKFKRVHYIRCAIYTALKRGKTPKTGRTCMYLGCSIPEALAHIESQFIDGMTWANWSVGGWHLDHIRPIASFDQTVEGWEFEANHYTNLQPLWAFDNLSKGDKWVSGCSEELAPQPN
jgi:hypothetical protein